MSIWQTKNWQEMLVLSWQTKNFFIIDDIYIEKRKVFLKEYGLFVLWLNKNILSKSKIKKLINLCKQEKCLFIQIEFLDYKNIKSFNNLNSLINIRKEYNWFNKWFYKKFITPFTAVIDLQKSEDEILAWMKPKWRYNIRLSEKKWVKAKTVEKNIKNIKIFYDLMLETTNRDKFNWNSLDFYQNFLKNIKNSKLLFTYKWDIVIAWGIFVFDREVFLYYYWASTSNKKYRNLMAPYLLQWGAIKIAKKLNNKIYDFLWVSSPGESSSLSWVTDFKMKLTSDVREVSKSYIWINKNFKYYIIILLRKIRKSLMN